MPIQTRPIAGNQIAWYSGAAVGVKAGVPGEYTPPRATPPANLAATTGLVADPSTAWPVGYYAPLGDGSAVYWNGSAYSNYTATAGTPGAYAPAGFLPQSYVTLNTMGVKASPATNWTTGQHVSTADTLSANWNGTAWVQGTHP